MIFAEIFLVVDDFIEFFIGKVYFEFLKEIQRLGRERSELQVFVDKGSQEDNTRKESSYRDVEKGFDSNVLNFWQEGTIECFLPER